MLPKNEPRQCICCVICPNCKNRILIDKIKEHAKECSGYNFLKKRELITKMNEQKQHLEWLRFPYTLPPKTLPAIKSAIIRPKNIDIENEE